MRNFYRFDPGPRMPEIVRMIVEIPKNSNHKFELDPRHGVFRLSRTLYSPIHYPGDYGFIPGTLAEDGDPLDILCMVNSPSYPGILIYVRPVAVLELVDEGKLDHKILAVPDRDPRFDAIQSAADLRPHWRVELEHFFAIYKELEEKQTEIRGWRDREAAYQVIRESRERVTLHRAQS
jgi:inorganic pyrophosphatase